MQFDSFQYYSIIFSELIIDRLEFYRKKYQGIPILQKVLSGIRFELKEKIFQNPLSETWFESGPYVKFMHSENPDLKNQIPELMKELDRFKTSLDAEDFYIIKSFFTDNKNDEVHFLMMARMLNPEDLLSHIAARLNCVEFLIEEVLIDIARNWPDHFISDRIRKLFNVVLLVSEFSENPEKVSLLRLQNLITRDNRLKGLVNAMIRDALKNKASKYLLKIIENIYPGVPGQNKEIDMLKSHVIYKTGDYSKALQIIEPIDIEEMDMNIYEQFECFNLKAKIYYACGQKGKAMLLWRGVANDEDFKYSFSDSYFEAIIGLASIYVDSGQAQLAKKTIRLLDSACMVKYLIGILGAEYYIIRGKICISENRKKHAIRMFKNSLNLKENQSIRKKLKMLELGLA